MWSVFIIYNIVGHRGAHTGKGNNGDRLPGRDTGRLHERDRQGRMGEVQTGTLVNGAIHGGLYSRLCNSYGSCIHLQQLLQDTGAGKERGWIIHCGRCWEWPNCWWNVL